MMWREMKVKAEEQEENDEETKMEEERVTEKRTSILKRQAAVELPKSREKKKRHFQTSTFHHRPVV